MRKSFTGSGALKLALNNGVDPNAKIKTFNIDERNLIFLAIKKENPTQVTKNVLSEPLAWLSVRLRTAGLQSFGATVS